MTTLHEYLTQHEGRWAANLKEAKRIAKSWEGRDDRMMWFNDRAEPGQLSPIQCRHDGKSVCGICAPAWGPPELTKAKWTAMRREKHRLLPCPYKQP